MDEIELNKVAILRRCLLRIREEYQLSQNLSHFSHIDAMTLNIERACQACIVWAMHRISKKRLGMPQSNSDAFRILATNTIISEKLCSSLQAMCGFRNIAVHEDQTLDHQVLRTIAEHKLSDFEGFAIAMGAKAFDIS